MHASSTKPPATLDAPAVIYLPDADVDAAVDAEIRTLLTTCFLKPQDTVFRTQRYFREPYPHRWIIRDAAGRMLAHIGVHEKTVQAAGRVYPIAGIAEVCVHQDCRGRGYVRYMLEAAHARMRAAGRAFAVLFGNPDVYGSSGYLPVANLAHDADASEGGTRRQSIAALVRPLADGPWPSGEVYLPGPTF